MDSPDIDLADAVALILVVGGILLVMADERVIGGAIVLFGVLGLVISQTTRGIVNTLNATRQNTKQAQSNPQASSMTNHDHDTIESDSFIHYTFSLDSPAVLDARVSALSEKEVNVILTTSEERKKFNYQSDIKYFDDATEFQTNQTNIQKRLKPGEYSILIDNTGRLKNINGSIPVDIEFEYELRY